MDIYIVNAIQLGDPTFLNLLYSLVYLILFLFNMRQTVL
jgi:hypothetical protein